jgi:hypothetical protein
MIFKDQIEKKCDLDIEDSVSVYKNWGAQQNYKAFETFYYFIKEIKPKRILEIGTSIGGFVSFLNYACKDLNIDCEIMTLDIKEFPWYPEIIEQGVNIKVENVFSENYDSVSQYIIDFIKSEGTTVILCDGGDKKSEFNLLSNYIKEGDFIMGHDYSYDLDYFEKNVYKKIWNWCELIESDIESSCERNNLIDYRRDLFQSIAWVCKIKNSENFMSKNIENNQTEILEEEIKSISNSKITFVTGLWDIKRESLTEGWSRSYEHYLQKFSELLKIDINLIIFGDENLEKFVFERRDISNTQFIVRSSDWFKTSVPYEKIQEIRQNSNWINQSGWLADSTQSKLEMYNPLVMSKMFLLHDAKILDKFDSEELYWIDAGISNTVHPGYFTHDKVQYKLKNFFKKFSFVCFPYKADNEIHGFSYPEINNYAGDDVNLVARGGFFGGPKETISEINSLYYHSLITTLSDGFMGTEESVFSILVYKNSDLINYFEIEDNGLLGKFFEDLKNEKLVIKNKSSIVTLNNYDKDKTSLYVITFNSPKQFETLIESMLSYDENFINRPKKYLLDNSTDLTTTDRYLELCEKHGFEHIKKDNLGITGGRQWIAEHFEESQMDYMFFFEDDMFFYLKKGEVCRNGFNRYSDNLYEKSLEIIEKENFDFLKLNFSEFFGDNSTQWSWYNVPQVFREQHWPKNKKLPQMGLDPNAPKTQFKEIKSHKGVPYASGEIYLCNWPIVLSKMGSYKCYLETKYASPFEQTLMSHNYQETIKGNLNPGILLMTPTEHNRFEHYDGSLRKEC